MAALADHNSAETAGLLAACRDGTGAAGRAFDRHRDRLRRAVALRLDRRLAGRVDPLDVVRDACSAAAGELDNYLRDPDEPLFLWLRRRVAARLAAVHREHLGDDAAPPQLAPARGALPDVTPAALAACLLGANPTAPRQLLRVQDGLNALDPLDRELLALRHFEQLSRSEAARVLGIDEGAVARRYVLALKALNALLAPA